MSHKKATLIIHGKSISPGLSEGITFLHRDMLHSLDAPTEIEIDDIEKEIDYLDKATIKITDDLLVLSSRIEKEMDSKLAAIFDAHQLMLNDQTLREELRKEIRENLVSASSAVKSVFLRWEKRFQLMETQIAKQKGDDIHDISNRLSNALKGTCVHPLENMPDGRIFVTNRLMPSDTIFLSQHSTSAVLLEYGGAGSHAALFVREMGIPCITDIKKIMKKIPTNTYALIDANKAEIIIAPKERHKVIFRQKTLFLRKTFIKSQENAKKNALTKDGIKIDVFANVGCPDDTKRAMENGADGVGLYRIEQIYMGRINPPNINELFDEMINTLEPAKGKPVYVRLLDVGADKPLPFIGFLAETNPALGRRGIRFLNEYPTIIETQLQAIVRLSEEFDLKILVPMVTLPRDMAFVKESLNKLCSKLGISSIPKLGAMIETPAAALSAQKIIPFAEFLSFGTNDLTQYSFAADRENVAVEKYFNDSSDIIFRLIDITHNDVPEVPLSVCGELAGQPEHISRLLKSGVRTLSVAPPLIPIIKEAVRETYCNPTII